MSWSDHRTSEGVRQEAGDPDTIAATDPGTTAARPESARARIAAVAIFVLVTVAALTWAKWWPYAHKVPAVIADHTLGSSALAGESGSVPSPSLQAGLDYSVTYFSSIWIALLAGFGIAAAVEAFLPRHWLLRAMARRRGGGDVMTAGLLSTATMMCSCCAAPVASSLRRQGASAPASLAYWIGNPVLNPVVLVFLAVLMPWEWVAARVAVGILLVFVVTAAIGRFATKRDREAALEQVGQSGPLDCGPVVTPTLRAGALRFVRALGLLARRILPEYVIVVFVLGALRGWLFAVSEQADLAAVPAVVLLAVAGTLFPIATAGEIPIIQSLLASGIVAPAVAATLLVTLPAANLPAFLIMRRAMSWRVLLTVAAAIVGAGIVTALVFAALL